MTRLNTEAKARKLRLNLLPMYVLHTSLANPLCVSEHSRVHLLNDSDRYCILQDDHTIGEESVDGIEQRNVRKVAGLPFLVR